MICPNCKSTNVKPAIMLEEGIEYPIHRCEDCAWWL